MPGRKTSRPVAFTFTQMDAAYHISIGDNATARVLLEGAVHITPSSANHATVDLLQILALSGDWRAYEKRRRLSPFKTKVWMSLTVSVPRF